MVQRLARVIETSLVGGIDGEFARGTQVHACQVADGVVVLGVAEAPVEHGTRIAGMLADFLGADCLNPLDHLLAGLGGRLRRLLGRHLLAVSRASTSSQRG